MEDHRNFVVSQLSGRFSLVEKIGEGGMGAVYKGYDDVLQRFVTIKILHQDLAEQAENLYNFTAEAHAVSSLNHPHICTIYDVGQSSDFHYLVMEYVDGASLRQLLADRGRLTESEVIAIGIQIGQALSAAHNKGIIHGDIKPDNILISKDGLVKVTDFGLAKSLQADEPLADLSLPYACDILLQGTMAYVAPEQIDGKLIDVRTDLFALGIVLYELLTGAVPFKADRVADLLQAILNRSMPKLSSQICSLQFNSVLQRLLDKDPSVRYESAAELTAALSHCNNSKKIIIRFFEGLARIKQSVSGRLMPGRAALLIPGVLLLVVVTLVWIKTAIGPAPTSPALAYYLRGQEYLATRYETNYSLALDLFNKCLRIEPDYPLACSGIAEVFLNRFEWYIQRDVALLDSAKKYIDRALQKNSSLAEAHAANGDYYRLKNAETSKQAIQEYMAAHRKKPNVPDFVFKLIRIYRELNNESEAKKWIQLYANMKPTHADVYVEIANLAWFHGRFQEAENYFDKAIALQPDSPNPIGLKAYYMFLRGDWDRAEDLYKSLRNLDQASRQAVSCISLIHYFKGNVQDALSSYQTLLEMGVKEGLDFFHLAAIYRERGDSVKASTMLDSAFTFSSKKLQNSPQDHLWLSELAVIYAFRGEKSPALDYLSRAKETRDFKVNYIRKSRVLLRESMVYSLLGDIEKSAAVLRVVLATNMFGLEYIRHCIGLEQIRETAEFETILTTFQSKNALTLRSKHD